MKKEGLETTLDAKYLDMLKNTYFQPIFIMGLHRSGTSVLYKILSATRCFNTVTAYHLIEYDQLIHNHINKQEEIAKGKLTDFFRRKGQADRGIDQLQITADFSEEYGFLLSKKTGHFTLNSITLPVFKEMCKKIQFISDCDKPLLLKNPWDFSNFVFIKYSFPSAKFIFIHRNPLKVLNSQIKTNRTLLKSKSHYMSLLFPYYNKIFKNKILLYYSRCLNSSICPIHVISAIRNLNRETDQFLENIYHLKEEDYISVRYEDLCTDPNKVISRIVNFLNLQVASTTKFNNFIKPRRTILLKELEISQSYLFKKTSKYISYCGYKLDDLYDR